ncbi:hypothetical protein [Leifsonia sp. Leaf264]|uniref:hypothetical protein n=1 Tax=Leifsonia sp. Leaf264 TaxID=1736314 RepID=UPI000ACE5C5F|nr:hypothetical protein [Leifsonia sp. Leaf264]
MYRALVIDVDRDSVAMGDDGRSHAHQVTVARGTRLSALLDRAAPEIRARGWSWVAVADGRVVAVWSSDHGVQLLVPDARVTSKRGPRRVDFRYYLQIDPAWLHRRLAEGADPDREALELEYRPQAQAAWELEARRRERDDPARLLSPECIAAVQSFGAQIDLHNDRQMRLDILGTRWTVIRSDTMTQIHRGEDALAASIRPAAFAECWLVAAIGAEARLSIGLPRLPDFQPLPAPELTPMAASWPQGVKRWTTTGDLIAQLAGEDAVSCYRLASGRSIAEIAQLLAKDAPAS